MDATYPEHRFLTARRTVTETDIVTFINLAGLHEPIFADQEYVKANMPASHHRRFAPAPLSISMGMGLVAPHVTGWMETVLAGHPAGKIGGLIHLNAKVLGPVYAGDTLQVELFIKIAKITSKGYTLVDLRHLMTNQDSAPVIDFTETVILLPPEA